MTLIFEDGFDEVDTFEAFFKIFHLKGDKLLIPYINVGVSNHPLNPFKELLHLDFSYIVCLDIALIKYNGNLLWDNTIAKMGSYKFIYLGGTNLDEKANVEYQILCKKAFLQTRHDTKTSSDFWRPASEDILSNMNESQVDLFFSLNDLPQNISDLFN